MCKEHDFYYLIKRKNTQQEKFVSFEDKKKLN